MSLEIKIPSVGESVQEAVLAEWFKQDGDTVRKDEALFVIETDKVTLEVVAEADQVYHLAAAVGVALIAKQPIETIDVVDPRGVIGGEVDDHDTVTRTRASRRRAAPIQDESPCAPCRGRRGRPCSPG